MIKIYKVGIPSKLASNAAIWLKNYMSASTPQERKKALSHYRCEEIKNALKLETGNKCAYCESSMLHVAYGDVEHIIPKSEVPSKTFEWENLTLVCDVCNTNKGKYYNPTLPLVNPYIDEPADHFVAFGNWVRTKPGSDRALPTIDKLNLNRLALIEKRMARIQAIENLATVYFKAHPENQSAIGEQIKLEVAQNKEYLMFVRRCLHDAGLTALIQ